VQHDMTSASAGTEKSSSLTLYYFYWDVTFLQRIKHIPRHVRLDIIYF